MDQGMRLPYADQPGLIDRFTGCLIGLACGDAIGGPAEFYRRGRFTPITGMQGGGKFKLQAGEWTDDTAMSLCLAESLVECQGMNVLDQMQRYWRWADEGYHSTRSTAFGVGKTVAEALCSFHRTGNPLAGPTRPRSSGNGSIMRLAPVAMYFHGRPEILLDAAELSSRTTHGSEECVAACRFMAAILHRCLEGVSTKEETLSWASTLILPKELSRLADQRFRHADISEIQGTGYVVDSLEAALWCFWHTETYEEAVLQAANLGDDTDTTAAVCGQIAGAYYGISTIPLPWLASLHSIEHITQMAESLFQSSSKNHLLI